MGTPTPPVPLRVETSNLAIWSLVLSILGYCCLFVFGFIPGVILGHMALSSIRSSGGRLTGEGMAIAGLIIGYIGLFFSLLAIVAMLAGIALPAFSLARDKARQAQSLNNLRQISLAVEMYQMEHTNEPPPSLKALVPYIVGTNNPSLFLHPGSGTVPGSMETVDSWSDYQLVTGPAGDNASEDMRAFTKPRATGNHGQAVLYQDGHVEWREDDSSGPILNPLKED